MLDYQRIVDDVRNLLHSASEETIDFLRSAAADYALACDEVNDRLRQCEVLLKRRLRSEAIQQAEVEPALLDLVATLDIPEREQWIATVERFGIAAPPPLLIEIAADLNEAFAIEAPLAVQLTRHRLLALARAPLRDRIDVLHRLASLDGDNPVWQEDLLVFERARQRQLKDELAQATAKGDLATVEVIDAELQQAEWLEAPPPQLVRWAGDYRRRLAVSAARIKLEKLEPALNDAYSSLDVDAARNVRAQWSPLAVSAELDESDPLAERAALVFEWLDEEERREREQFHRQDAVASLEHALVTGAGRADLEKLFGLATWRGHDLPEDLKTRYHSRLEKLALAASRRWRLSLTAIIVVSVLVGVAIVVPIYYSIQSHRVTAQVAALTSLIEEEKLSEADAFIVRLGEQSAGVLDEPRIASLLARLADLKQSEIGRRDAFRVALGASLAGGAGQPDWKALGRAEQLAKTDSERSDITAVRAKIDAANRELQKDHESQYLAALKALDQQIAEVERTPQGDLNERQQAIAGLQSDLDSVEQRYHDISADIRQQGKSLAARLSTQSRAVRTALEAESHEVAINRAIGDSEAFVAALNHYIEHFPDDKRSADFRRVVAEASLWKQVEAWNAFLRRWQPQLKSVSGIPDATELVEAISNFCNKHPDWPERKAVQRKLPFFEAILHRVEDDQPIQNSLIQLFRDPLVADVWIVELKNGKRRLYTRNEPNLDNFKQLKGFDFKEKTLVPIKPNELARPPGKAPQVALAGKVLPILAKLNNENWDESFPKIIAILAKNEPQMESLLRLRLLQQTLEVAAKGSHCLEIALDHQLKSLQRSGVSPTANWLDPDDSDANESRVKAEQELDSLGSFDALPKAVAKSEAAMRAPFGRELIWVGRLRSVSPDQTDVVFDASRRKAGELFVVVVGANDPISLISVGHMSGGATELKREPAALLDGRPVYVAPR